MFPKPHVCTKTLDLLSLECVGHEQTVDGVQLHRSWLQPSAALYLGRSEEVLCGAEQTTEAIRLCGCVP